MKWISKVPEHCGLSRKKGLRKPGNSDLLYQTICLKSEAGVVSTQSSADPEYYESERSCAPNCGRGIQICS